MNLHVYTWMFLSIIVHYWCYQKWSYLRTIGYSYTWHSLGCCLMGGEKAIIFSHNKRLTCRRVWIKEMHILIVERILLTLPASKNMRRKRTLLSPIAAGRNAAIVRGSGRLHSFVQTLPWRTNRLKHKYNIS